MGRRGAAIPVQTVVVAANSGGEGAAKGNGNVVVVANGYVVARTKAAVSAKIPGRLAQLNVSEGSSVQKGEVIARLDNADYAAAVGQAEAGLASARATLIEAQSDRDQMQRDYVRVRDIHAQNPNLVSPQDVENADSRARQAGARFDAQSARVDAAAAALRVAQANLENTYVRAAAAGSAQPVERPRIIVPADAVRSENGRDVVWIVRDGRLQRRDVDAGPVSGNFREIRSGLAGGEQLLVGGIETPKEGQRVRPNNQ